MTFAIEEWPSHISHGPTIISIKIPRCFLKYTIMVSWNPLSFSSRSSSGWNLFPNLQLPSYSLSLCFLFLEGIIKILVRGNSIQLAKYTIKKKECRMLRPDQEVKIQRTKKPERRYFLWFPLGKVGIWANLIVFFPFRDHGPSRPSAYLYCFFNNL